MSSNANAVFWAVVPAAGVGRRMGSEIPKQYLTLHGRSIIEHSIERLLAHDRISGAMIALDESDSWWPELVTQTSKPIMTTHGGQERSDSVLNALVALRQHLGSTSTSLENVWVLVHDAARPCVRTDDIDRLIREGSQHDNGGLLALPVRDTMKRASDRGEVIETVDRHNLWHALTPQMFRLELLEQALRHAISENIGITDDASAMELMGYHPALIEAHEDNIKVTRPFDLELAHIYIDGQKQ